MDGMVERSVKKGCESLWFSVEDSYSAWVERWGLISDKRHALNSRFG